MSTRPWLKRKAMRQDLPSPPSAPCLVCLPPGEPVKGPCWKCGAPVTCRGDLCGFRTLTMEVIHWRCPTPAPVANEPEQFDNPDDPIAWADMPDVRTVVEDLFRERWHPERIGRHLGLTAGEVKAILGLKR